MSGTAPRISPSFAGSGNPAKRKYVRTANLLFPLGESVMNYSCTRYELKCNECGKRYGNQPLSACPDCSGTP